MASATIRIDLSDCTETLAELVALIERYGHAMPVHARRRVEAMVEDDACDVVELQDRIGSGDGQAAFRAEPGPALLAMLVDMRVVEAMELR